MSLTEYNRRNDPVPMLLEPSIELQLSRLQCRRQYRGWPLPLQSYDRLREQWRDHAGPQLPTVPCLRFGGGIAYDWTEALAWVSDIAAGEGLSTNLDYAIRPNELRSYPIASDLGREFACGMVGLDLTGAARPDDASDPYILPGVEILWFLALNPAYLLAMDGQRVPYLAMPGLEVGKGGMPVIGRGSTGIFVYAAHRDNPHAGVFSRMRVLR